MRSTFMEENFANMEEHKWSFTFMEDHSKNMSAHAFLAFLGQLKFWMNTIWVARWNGLKILIPKHMWKSKIRLLEQKLDKKPYVIFF